jgi:thiamine kinase-like enzyme
VGEMKLDNAIGRRINSYFEGLKPARLGLKGKIRVSSVKKLGMGANNANFLIVANGKKFVFRLNMLISSKDKSRSEFNSLKLVEKLGIAPKAWILDDSRKVFDSDFIILDYLEGKTLAKTGYSLNNTLVKKISRLCVKFHVMPLRGNLLKLKRDETSYEDLLGGILRRYHSIQKMISNKDFLGFVYESYENLREKSLVGKVNHPLVLAHGDICEQNIIIHKGKMKLIDYEGLGITDPANEIAYIFTQFGRKEFKEKPKEIFLEEYLKFRKDDSLRERVGVFMPLKNFADLLWAVQQALKIKHGLMHKHYIEENTLKDAVAYAQKVFERCIADGSIGQKYKNFDLGEVIR